MKGNAREEWAERLTHCKKAAWALESAKADDGSGLFLYVVQRADNLGNNEDPEEYVPKYFIFQDDRVLWSGRVSRLEAQKSFEMRLYKMMDDKMLEEVTYKDDRGNEYRTGIRQEWKHDKGR